MPPTISDRETFYYFTIKTGVMKSVIVSLFALWILCSFNINQNGTPLYASLTGSAEVPGPGDPDGSGTIYLDLNQGQGTITYELTVENIDPAMAAHIHIGGSTVAGPVLYPLEPPTDGSSSGTIMNVDKETMKALRQNPGNYYVNVHNTNYPAGAVRGQLQK
jgi:hypothetical protein